MEVQFHQARRAARSCLEPPVIASPATPPERSSGHWSRRVGRWSSPALLVLLLGAATAAAPAEATTAQPAVRTEVLRPAQFISCAGSPAFRVEQLKSPLAADADIVSAVSRAQAKSGSGALDRLALYRSESPWQLYRDLTSAVVMVDTRANRPTDTPAVLTLTRHDANAEWEVAGFASSCGARVVTAGAPSVGWKSFSASPRTRKLAVALSGALCDHTNPTQGYSVEVTESPNRVDLRVTPRGRFCFDQPSDVLQIALRAPLGSRALYDAGVFPAAVSPPARSPK